MSLPWPIIVALAGGAGTGKSSVGQRVAANFRAIEIPAVCLPTGIVFRLFARIALEAAATAGREPLSFTAEELVEVARTQGVTLGGDDIIYLGATRVPITELKAPRINEIVGHWGNDPATTEFAKSLIRQLANSFAGIVIIEGRSVCLDYANVARFRVTLVAPSPLASIRSGQPIERIIARDAQDMMSGALPLVPIAFTINTDWYPSVDQVASEIMSRLLQASYADLAPLLVGWVSQALTQVTFTGPSE